MQRIATKSRYFTCNAGLNTVLTTLQTRGIPCQLLPYVLYILSHRENVIATKILMVVEKMCIMATKEVIA